MNLGRVLPSLSLVTAFVFALQSTSAQVTKPAATATAPSASAAPVAPVVPAAGALRPMKPAPNPEAAALILGLLARYADDVQDKTEVDRSVARALDAMNARAALRDGIRRFEARPIAERRLALGSFADTDLRAKRPVDRYRAVFGQLGRTRGAVVAPLVPATLADPFGVATTSGATTNTKLARQENLGPLPQVAPRVVKGALGAPAAGSGLQVLRPATTPGEPWSVVKYTGLWCESEMDWDRGSDSDEIYVVVSALTLGADGLPVVTSTRHPMTQAYYGDVDSREKRDWPIAEVWRGTGQDLQLVVHVMEQDGGDPDAFLAAVGATWATGLGVAVLTGGIALVGAALASIFETVVWILDLVFGAADDPVGDPQSITLSAERLRQLRGSDAPPYGSTGMAAELRTRHTGGGADYRVLFRVDAP